VSEGKNGVGAAFAHAARPGEPVFVIPDAGPHSDKKLHDRKYTDVIEGEELEPVFGSLADETTSAATEVTGLLTGKYKIRLRSAAAFDALAIRDVVEGGCLGFLSHHERLLRAMTPDSTEKRPADLHSSPQAAAKRNSGKNVL
jgi:aspartyl aminopeptidase